MILKTICSNKKVEDDSAITQKQRSETFEHEGVQCEYKNMVRFSTQKKSSQKKISISNKICKSNGEGFEKVTIIRFNNRVVQIKDDYFFKSNLPVIEQKNRTKRVQLFKQPLKNDRKGDKKRVTKNLAKNFIKAFMNFLEKEKNEENSSLIELKMKILTRKQKFNNSLIQRIIDDDELEPFFSNFLKKQARDWILHSKIREKNIHLEAIDIFLRLRNSQRGRKRLQSGLQDIQDNSFSISGDISLNQIMEHSQSNDDNFSNIANSPKSNDLNIDE